MFLKSISSLTVLTLGGALLFPTEELQKDRVGVFSKPEIIEITDLESAAVMQVKTSYIEKHVAHTTNPKGYTELAFKDSDKIPHLRFIYETPEKDSCTIPLGMPQK